MSALQVIAIVVSLTFLVVGVGLLVRAIGKFVAVFRMGAAAPGRTNAPVTRTVTLTREFLGHTRMARIPAVAVAHWVTMISFGLLFLTLVTAFGQVFDAHFALPIIGRFAPFEWLTELFAWGGFFGILYLIFVRQKNHPRNAAGEHGRRSRFFGSTFWQAYFVEGVILGVVVCIIALRALEYVLALDTGSDDASALHFPLTAWLGSLMSGMSADTAAQLIYLVATLKIAISFTWMIVISLTLTMGVAWHRFLAFFNIWFKRHADGRTSLGALQPMTHDGTPVTAETLEEVMDDESGDVKMGVGAVEDFTWKGLLDFSTCTECGRCQSQCPAWNTDKPLSPKLLVMAMRDHAHAKAPLVLAGASKAGALPEATQALADMPLVGATGYTDDPRGAYTPHGPDAVIDEDVLWSCTTCGACVEQCPVDIEHVDAIVDMRRHQVLIESAFPSEFGGLFKNLESKNNPWGMAPKLRLDWAKGLDFEVPVVGQQVDDLGEVDYLFWVGCAGALEDRAKKTTRAVAELLHTAGVSFAVLGEGESCTGDAARRAGNEVLFQMLAAQNVETLDAAKATQIVVTCAHCFNTLKNEYAQIGGQYEVLHHTQLLNRLVREKRLTPVARPEDRPGVSTAKNAASTAPTVTYHDPCYLGRHNQVYAPPRELIGSLPGVTLTEMPRHGEKSFCCGAGGARMWAEEKLGTRINTNRTAEAVATGADRIAVGCPFCRVMLSDGLTAAQSQGEAREDVEVVDIAQMLLAAVRRGDENASATTSGSEGAPFEVAAPAAAGEDPAEVAAAQAMGATDAAAPPQAAESPAGDGDPVGHVRPDEEARPAPADTAAAHTTPTGTMSATDALAALQAQSAPTPAAPATPPAPAPQPANPTPTPPTPTGKMSATDALAALQAGPTPAAPATPPAAPAPQPTNPTPTPPTPTGKMSATDALAALQAQAGPAPAAPATPPAAPAPQPTNPAPTPPAPTGKMSATDALAALQAQSAPTPAAPATPPAAPAPQPANPTPTPPTGKMSATDALAALQAQAGASAAAREDQASAATGGGEQTPAAATTPEVVRAATPAPPATPAPTGRMTATEALALLQGSGPTPPKVNEPTPAQPQPLTDAAPSSTVDPPTVDTPGTDTSDTDTPGTRTSDQAADAPDADPSDTDPQTPGSTVAAAGTPPEPKAPSSTGTAQDTTATPTGPIAAPRPVSGEQAAAGWAKALEESTRRRLTAGEVLAMLRGE